VGSIFIKIPGAAMTRNPVSSVTEEDGAARFSGDARIAPKEFRSPRPGSVLVFPEKSAGWK
jgi:hypothetical protein